MADVAAAVPDGNLPVVLNPALAAQNVVDAGRHLVPLVVVSTPEWKKSNMTMAPLDTALCVLLQLDSKFSPRKVYMGGTNWNNLHGLSPELVLTPQICRIKFQTKSLKKYLNVSGVQLQL